MMEENGGDVQSIRDWHFSELEKNIEDGRLAKEYGFGFFSPKKESFDGYANSVVDYLLS